MCEEVTGAVAPKEAGDAAAMAAVGSEANDQAPVRTATEAEIAETVAAFDGEMDCAGITLSDVAAKDGDEPDPERDEKHYGLGNIVMFDVPHVRVCRGETGEVLTRMRSSEAENEVLEVVKEIGSKNQPDWFTELWFEGFRQLVVVAVFESEESAMLFKRGMHGRRFCKPRGGRNLRETMLAKYNHTWTLAHNANFERMAKSIMENDERFGSRIVIARTGYDGGDAEARKRFDEIAKVLSDKFPTVGGKLKFHWSVVNDMESKVIRLGFGGDDAEEIAKVRDELESLGCDAELAKGMTVAVSTRDGDADMALVVAIENAMVQDERKREAAAKAEAMRLANEAKVKPQMGEPVGGKTE